MRPPVLPGLFTVPVADIAGPAFDGATYQPEKDHARLSGQLMRVAVAMQDGRWHTLAEIEKITDDPQASISARIRDCRKKKFMGAEIEHRRRTDAQWEYRMVMR